MTSVPSKVGRVLIDRITASSETNKQVSKVGGTVEHIFILRNIIEQVVEWQSTLYITSVDFKKAFDSVHRESLWKNYGELWNSMQDNPHGTDVIRR